MPKLVDLVPDLAVPDDFSQPVILEVPELVSHRTPDEIRVEQERLVPTFGIRPSQAHRERRLAIALEGAGHHQSESRPVPTTRFNSTSDPMHTIGG